MPGLRGKDGLNGRPGRQGPKGDAADPAPLPPSRGFAIVRHSQAEIIPVCPKGTIKLWDGFSLLHVHSEKRTHGQDLGKDAFKLTSTATALLIPQAPLEAVYEDSAQCLICSAVGMTFAITPTPTTTASGYRPLNQCQ